MSIKAGGQTLLTLGLLALLCVGLMSTRAWSNELALASVPLWPLPELHQSCPAWMPGGGKERTAPAQYPLVPSCPQPTLCGTGSTQFYITLSLHAALAVLVNNRMLLVQDHTQVTRVSLTYA